MVLLARKKASRREISGDCAESFRPDSQSLSFFRFACTRLSSHVGRFPSCVYREETSSRWHDRRRSPWIYDMGMGKDLVRLQGRSERACVQVRGHTEGSEFVFIHNDATCCRLYSNIRSLASNLLISESLCTSTNGVDVRSSLGLIGITFGSSHHTQEAMSRSWPNSWTWIWLRSKSTKWLISHRLVRQHRDPINKYISTSDIFRAYKQRDLYQCVISSIFVSRHTMFSRRRTRSCTTAEMKKIAHTFDYNLWANNANPERTVVNRGKLIRAGKKGQGKTFFTEEGREISTHHAWIPLKYSPHIRFHSSMQLLLFWHQHVCLFVRGFANPKKCWQELVPRDKGVDGFGVTAFLSINIGYECVWSRFS